MQTQTLKQDVLDAVQRLPDNADIEEIMYRLYVVDKLHKSREAIRLGQVLSQDGLEQEMKQW